MCVYRSSTLPLLNSLLPPFNTLAEFGRLHLLFALFSSARQLIRYQIFFRPPLLVNPMSVRTVLETAY